jgi:hypothetical protein
MAPPRLAPLATLVVIEVEPDEGRQETAVAAVATMAIQVAA